MKVDSVESRPASFLAPAPVDDQVQRMYAGDLELQGYVANLTRVWAYSPEALAALSYVLRRAADTAGLDGRQRALLVTACASTIEDSYCSLAFGSKLAATDSPTFVARLLAGDEDELSHRDRALVEWARRVAGDPNATTPLDLDELRTVGYDDAQIFALTLFVALRIAFSSVNDALGAEPDAELAANAHPDVRTAITYGRPVGTPASDTVS
jgi:alkylhydroperoxidase family enzyme